MRGECGVNTGTNGNELPVEFITSVGRKLLVVSSTIGECPQGSDSCCRIEELPSIAETANSGCTFR